MTTKTMVVVVTTTTTTESDEGDERLVFHRLWNVCVWVELGAIDGRELTLYDETYVEGVGTVCGGCN